jgi:hypothetical protein
MKRRFLYEALIGLLIAGLLLWVAVAMNGDIPFVYQAH